MSTSTNKRIVRRLLEEALSNTSRTNPDVLHEYFAKNFVDHVQIHHQVSGVEGVKGAMTEVHGSAENFRMKITHMVAEGAWVAVHWQAAARRHSPLKVHRQLRGTKATGEERTVSGMTLFRLRGGKVVESWNYDNALELYR